MCTRQVSSICISYLAKRKLTLPAVLTGKCITSPELCKDGQLTAITEWRDINAYHIHLISKGMQLQRIQRDAGRHMVTNSRYNLSSKSKLVQHFVTYYFLRGSSVSIVSDYRLGDRGSVPGRGKGFFIYTASRYKTEALRLWPQRCNTAKPTWCYNSFRQDMQLW
jgi:hypothetical protein